MSIKLILKIKLSYKKVKIMTILNCLHLKIKLNCKQKIFYASMYKTMLKIKIY